MECKEFREIMHAPMSDIQDEGPVIQELVEHLDSCQECQAWLEADSAEMTQASLETAYFF